MRGILRHIQVPDQIRIRILLVPEFTAQHLDLVIDGFRIANRIAQQDIFRWDMLTEHPDGVEAGNGRICQPDLTLDPQIFFDVIFVIAGYRPEAALNDSRLSWFRNQDRRDTVIVAVDTGTVLLTYAGLGRGRKLAIHWEYEDILD